MLYIKFKQKNLIFMAFINNRTCSLDTSVFKGLLDADDALKKTTHPEYYKYYISLNENIIEEFEMYHLEKFLNIQLYDILVLDFLIKSFEKSKYLTKNEKFLKNENRTQWLHKVYRKNFIFLKKGSLSEFDKIIYDKFYYLIEQKTLNFCEEVVLVILINTLEYNNILRVADSSQESIENIFK
jgi:hypothetical protein